MERSPKRRRIGSEDDEDSAASSSQDELAAPAQNHTLKPEPHRRHSRLSPADNIHSGVEETNSVNNSEDELTLQFYRDQRHNRRTPTETPEPREYDSDHSPLPPMPEPLPSLAPQLHYRQSMILKGHKKGVAAVKFSPDGKWIASCSADATCKIWSATTGAHQHTLTGHLAGISTIAWSPDSRILASGSDDKSIRLWDAVAGRPHPTPLRGHHNYVYTLAFSPKGNMLVSGSYDEAVFVWDVRTARVLRSLPAHSDPIGGVDFVRDGTLIVSCSGDGLIRIWDTATGQCLRTFFHEDTPPVVSVRFSPNGKYVLAWTLDSSIRMWNYAETRCLKTYQGHKNEKYSLGGAFGVYGEAGRAFIVSGSEDGKIVFWDVVSKAILQKLEGHQGTVLGVDKHPTENIVVSCGLDRTIRIWKEIPPTAEGEDVDDEES